MPFRFGPMELIIVLVVVLIIFGVGRLPEIGGAMGKAIREFRSTQKMKVALKHLLRKMIPRFNFSQHP